MPQKRLHRPRAHTSERRGHASDPVSGTAGQQQRIFELQHAVWAVKGLSSCPIVGPTESFTRAKNPFPFYLYQRAKKQHFRTKSKASGEKPHLLEGGGPKCSYYE